MLRVPIAHAREGMTLALPVHHPDRPGTVLLCAGVALNDATIRRLMDIRARDLWIQYPGLEQIAQYVDPGVRRAHALVTGEIADAFDRARSSFDAKLDYMSYRSAIAGLIDKLSASPRANIFIEELSEAGDPMVRGASSVCLLSVLMGLKLGFYLLRERGRLSPMHARDVSALGVGAMLHDIGMLGLDEQTRADWDEQRDESDPAFREHVQLGFKMARGAIEPAAAAVILHHHQRFDGSGFPKRVTAAGESVAVSGRDIHVFARIAAAAVIFDRIQHAPGGAIPTVRALRRFLDEPVCHWVDPVVRSALLTVVPPYAPGSMVTLSTGQRGAVVSWSPLDPCRPTVEVIEDLLAGTTADEFDRERVDLREDHEIVVVEAEGESVTDDNFYPSSPGEFDLDLVARSLINAAAVEHRRSA